jgi:hypothetical protein
MDRIDSTHSFQHLGDGRLPRRDGTWAARPGRRLVGSVTREQTWRASLVVDVFELDSHGAVRVVYKEDSMGFESRVGVWWRAGPRWVHAQYVNGERRGSDDLPPTLPSPLPDLLVVEPHDE